MQWAMSRLRANEVWRRAYRLFRPLPKRRDAFAKAEVHIISYPKSGRTWLRVMIGKAICDQFQISETMLLKTYDLSAAAGLRRTRFTHDYSSIRLGHSYANLPTDKSKYRGKKVIFLVRNIRDLLVSCYFQATRRAAIEGLGNYSGSISEFIRDDRFGARKIVAFYNIWHANRTLPSEFSLVSYEDLHRDAAQVLRKTLAIMGLGDVSPAIVSAAVEYSRFENLRELEKRDHFDNPKLRPRDVADEESYKMRRGVVGGYGENLSEVDIRYIDEVIAEMGCPFLQINPGGLPHGE